VGLAVFRVALAALLFAERWSRAETADLARCLAGESDC